MIATRRIAQAAQRVPRLAAPVLEKIVAKCPRAKEGGGREEENRPGISSRRAGRLRNTNRRNASDSRRLPDVSTRLHGLSSVNVPRDVTGHVEVEVEQRFTGSVAMELN
jgi:hypothetical protein